LINIIRIFVNICEYIYKIQYVCVLTYTHVILGYTQNAKVYQIIFSTCAIHGEGIDIVHKYK